MASRRSGATTRWWTALLTALALMMVGAMFVVWSGTGKAARRSPAPVGEVTRLDTPVMAITASGTDEAVCKALIKPYGPARGEWEANVLAKGPDGLGGTGLFCEGETSSGIGAIAARASDNKRWTAQSLPIAQRNHPGDEVQVETGSPGRASLTRDSFVNESHDHIWTANGGQAWFGLLGYQ